MGTVYEALDQRVNCLVALKETAAGSGDEARRAFEREASLLGNLRHSALPKVTDYFSENDGDFLVMEFIPGYDLAELLDLRGAPFPQTQVLRWANDLLRVLEYLHGQEPPILHRDIKPSNLKLTKHGEIFLLDFGLAKGSVGQMPTLATSRSVRGYTPVYASLEQIHGHGTDARSDLYSLGATLYHLLSGVAPVDAPTRFHAVEDDQPDPLQPIPELNPQASGHVAAVIHQAVAISRKQRLISAAEMRKALRNAAEEDERGSAEEEYRQAERKRLQRAQTNQQPTADRVEGASFARTQSDDRARQNEPDIGYLTTITEDQQQSAQERSDDKQPSNKEQLTDPQAPPFSGQEAPRLDQASQTPIAIAKPQLPAPTIPKRVMLSVAVVAALVFGGLVIAWLVNRNFVQRTSGKPPTAQGSDTTPNKGGTATGPISEPCSAQAPTGGTGREYSVNLNGVKLDMVEIPSGSFCMGSQEGVGDNDEHPQHIVTVQGFYVGKYEITQSQYKAVTKTNPSNFKGCDECPAEAVSWEDAQEFLYELNKLNTGYTFRMPTEAEWEFACRAGTTGDYAGPVNVMGWYYDNSGQRTHPVGQKAANAFGLYDVHGNVWEWCEDWYHDNYSGAPSNGSAWVTGGEQKYRILRGGSWYDLADRTRSAHRGGNSPVLRGLNLGLRVVASLRSQ